MVSASMAVLTSVRAVWPRNRMVTAWRRAAAVVPGSPLVQHGGDIGGGGPDLVGLGQQGGHELVGELAAAPLQQLLASTGG